MLSSWLLKLSSGGGLQGPECCRYCVQWVCGGRCVGLLCSSGVVGPRDQPQLSGQ